MSPRDAIDRASIVDIWASLGGGDLGHGRGVAFWRGGDGLNVSLDEAKGVFFDHAHGTGGGILALVETVLGCDRPAALRWLAAHLGVQLDGQWSLTPAEKRAYAIRRCEAERKARELTASRKQRLRGLGDDRDCSVTATACSARWRAMTRRAILREARAFKRFAEANRARLERLQGLDRTLFDNEADPDYRSLRRRADDELKSARRAIWG